MSTPPAQPPPDAPRLHKIAEVRYSLPEMLEELKLERAAATFSMEKLDQAEIENFFKTKPTRRAKSSK